MADPPSDGERNKAFRAERRRQMAEALKIRTDTQGELLRLLKDAQTRIQAALASAPSDYQAWRLDRLKSEVARVIGELERGATTSATDGLTKSWNAGVTLVDAPIAAGGVSLAGNLAALDTQVLTQMRGFLVDRIKDVGAQLQHRIVGELGNVMMGMQTPFEAAQKVAEITGSAQKRGVTIVRTELGRAWSQAAQLRKEQTAELLPGLQKQWRRSGKRHPRHRHEVIDGQVRPVTEPFLLENGIKLMFPRDPKGPPAETVNCGCLSLPIMKSWEVRHPKERPFTPAELAASPTRRLLEDSRYSGFERWADRLFAGTAKPDGRFETLAQIPDAALKALKDRHGVAPAGAEIGVADKQLLHMARDTKARRGAALPTSVLRNLPALMQAPKALLWDRQAKALVLVLEGAADGKGRLPRVVVKLSDRDTRLKHQAHNWAVTAGYEDAGTLASAKRFDPLPMGGRT